MENRLASNMQVTGLGVWGAGSSAAAGQEGLSPTSTPSCSWGQKEAHSSGLGMGANPFLLQSTVVDLSRQEKGFSAAKVGAEQGYAEHSHVLACTHP